MRTGGILLLVMGAIILVWGAFGFKTREKVVDIGPIEATREETHYSPLGPIAGGVLLAGGLAMLVAARRT
jgi:hypothetical protein